MTSLELNGKRVRIVSANENENVYEEIDENSPMLDIVAYNKARNERLRINLILRKTPKHVKINRKFYLK